MDTRTVSAIFSAMLAIATALAQPPVPPNAQERTQEPSKDPTQAAAPDLADLLKTAHSAYLKGDYPSARASLDQAWSALEQSPRSEPQRYGVAKQLSTVLSAAGDYKAAQEYLQIAIDWREANHESPDDSKLIDDWIDMATLCQRLKDFDRAIALLNYARLRHARLNGAQSLPVADDYSRIALAYAAENQPDRAIPPLQMAIKIREAVLGAEHPAILSELDRLAALQLAVRNYPDAEESFRRSLVIRERLAGPLSSDLITSVEGLAYAQFGQKKYDEAEQGYKRLLSLWIISTQQPDHPMIALTLDKIEVFYREQKRWDEAENAAGKAIAIRGLFLANALKHEAAELLAHDDQPGAVKLLQRALSALDPSRAEHTALRSELQAALAEFAPQEKPVKPAATKSTKSTTTKATTTATTTKPQ
jgi:tetratricopeptide (TPR) repeat protein